MRKPAKNSVHKMRNVLWLHHMYFEKPNTSDEKLEPVMYLEDMSGAQEIDICDAYNIVPINKDADPEEMEGGTEPVSS